MLRAKLGLTAAAAKGRRATEHNVAAFDLKTCQAQSPQPKVGRAPSPAVPRIWLGASPSVSRSWQWRDSLLDLAFLTESPSFQRSDRASAKRAIYLRCCMYSLDVQNKVGIQWVHGEKINKFSESAGETLLLGCQLFSAETYRYMAQQTSAKWPRKGYALSRSQPASQAIKYRKLMVGGCALTSDGPALLQTDFCSCPASANKQHEKELFYWDDFLFKSASFISFHKTTKAAAGLAARRLRLQSAVLTRFIAVWFTQVSWLSVPFCYLPYMPYALWLIYCHILVCIMPSPEIWLGFYTLQEYHYYYTLPYIGAVVIVSLFKASFPKQYCNI